MSLFLDKEFVDRIRFLLAGFEWEREYIANFRCPLCGDSQRSTKKRRGYFYPDTKENVLRFKCHNCSEQSGWSFQFWLKSFNNTVYQEYQMELFRESGGSPSHHRTTDDNKLVAPKASTTARVGAIKAVRRLPEALSNNFTRICDLPTSHEARVYMEGRRFPAWAYELFGYVDNYRDLVQALGIGCEEGDELLKKVPNDRRVIIPLLSETMQLMGIQGRAMDESATLRYATAKLNPDYAKTFGLHRLDRKKPIIVVEGPFDSTFLPNCVATADSNLLKFEAGNVYIPDNQYRNWQICTGIEKIIDSGKKICLFPPEVAHKDINDMVTKGGMTQGDLLKLVGANIFQGLKAKMRWADLRKV